MDSKLREKIMNYKEDQLKKFKLSLVMTGVAGILVIFYIGYLMLVAEQLADANKGLCDNLYGVDVIVLSGFLLLVPGFLLDAYPHRILNIHPSLLPLHGGKGMHGLHVHEDVLRSGDRESGITVHVCDADLDRGVTLFQAKCPVERGDTPESLAARVHKLEYAFFPEVVERFCEGGYDYLFK